MTLRVGIIGAGKRVKYTVLPGVWALGDKAKITQINTRTPQNVDMPDGSQIPTVTSLSDLSLGSIDILIVSVGTNSIYPILSELSSKQDKDQINLVMDTPPLRLSDFRRFDIFKGFKSVTVGEDWIRLPTIIAAKKIIERGDIGELRSIRFDHFYYRYHGLSALKELASVNAVRSIRRRALGNGFFESKYQLKKNVVATSLEPRDYDNGRMLITGTNGYISNFKLGKSSKARFEIQYVNTTQGWYQPISINDEVQEPDAVDQFMSMQPFDYLEDKTEINRLKIRGFAHLLEELANGNMSYPITQGLYDYLAVAAAEKTGRFYDITLSGSRSSLMGRIMKFHGG